MRWLTPTPEGTPPSPRMGCSAAFLPARYRGAASHIVLLGGCDGNDLLRNGEDFFGSVHVRFNDLCAGVTPGPLNRRSWNRC